MERKVCVVTGSSAGIGAACVRLYASRGWNVVINYSRELGPADEHALLIHVYSDVPQRLHPVALRSLRAHLDKLHAEERVHAEGGAWAVR